MRILHLISQRPDSTGSGIMIRALIRQAAVRQHDNMLVAGVQSDRPAEVPELPAEYRRFVRFFSESDRSLTQGVDAVRPAGSIGFEIPGMSDVMPYPSSRFGDLSPEQLRTYQTVFQDVVKSAVQDFQPDIIHSHHLWLMSSVARQCIPELPMVTSCHGSDLRQFQNCPHLRKAVLDGCRRIDAVLALSAAQRQDIASLYGIDPNRIFVTGAGYNDALFQPVDKPRSAPVRLVYAGKLSRAKGVPRMLETLKGISDPPWVLSLVGSGSGEERDECMALARALGDRVIIHGAVSQPDLAAIMKASHVLILPSFFEGLPLVIIEALAAGCRVVATDLPGVRELVKGLPESCVSRVPVPRMRRMDQPYLEDLPIFMKHLSGAIRTQMQHAVRSPDIEDNQVKQALAGYTWSGVFERIQTIYQHCLSIGRHA